MAFGQRLLTLITDNRVPGNLDANLVGNLQLDDGTVNFCHGAVDAAGRHDAIADFERVKEFLKLLLPPLCGQQDDEIEDREDERNRYELNVWIHARALRRSHGEYEAGHS